MNWISFVLRQTVISAVLLAVTAYAQNPVPQIVGPVKPTAVAPGSGAFTLSVYGANFVSGSVVNWNGQARSTSFVSAHEVRAQILASDIAANTAGLISVTNPPPGGGISSAGWAQVEVHAPISTITLAQPKSYTVGGYLELIGDFTNSQDLDLVGQYGDALFLYTGKEDGTFHFGSIAARYYDSNGGAIGDFNGDGNLDFAYGQNPPNNPTVGAGVMLGNGHGNFAFASGITNELDPNLSIGGIFAGDFNQDGKLDLIVTNTQGFSLFLGNGDGTFRHFTDVVTTVSFSPNILVGDFNGDGRLDVITFINPGGGGGGTYISFFAGNGDGTFQPEQSIISTTSIFGELPRVTDLNADGNLDVIFQTLTDIVVLLGNGNGTFQSPVSTTIIKDDNFVLRYATGDFYSTGTQALLVQEYLDAYIRSFTFFKSSDNGTFQETQTIREPVTSLPLSLGDFNSDGLLDFIFPTGSGMDVYLQQ